MRVPASWDYRREIWINIPGPLEKRLACSKQCVSASFFAASPHVICHSLSDMEHVVSTSWRPYTEWTFNNGPLLSFWPWFLTPGRVLILDELVKPQFGRRFQSQGLWLNTLVQVSWDTHCQEWWLQVQETWLDLWHIQAGRRWRWAWQE